MSDKTNNHISSISLEVFNSKAVLVPESFEISESRDEYITEKIYNPHEHRIIEHPNNFVGAFIHLVKSSLGTGILAVPRAFKSAGLLVGIIGNILVGLLCTHTVYILVQASQKVSTRAKVPSLGFADTVEEVFKRGPTPIRQWSGVAKLFVELALVSTYYLSVAVYMVFISVSLTKLLSSYYHGQTESWDHYIFKLIIMALLIVLCQIRNLKHLVPFSFIANILMVVAFGITGYYIFSGLKDNDNSNARLANGFAGIPSFFSTILFAMEGIGSIMPLENSMPKPNFLGTCGVLNSAMVLVVFFFTSVGFFGYYSYGDKTEVTITANLPTNEILAQIAQAAIAISVFFSFTLQFFIPTDILWQRLKPKLPEKHHNIAQIVLRTLMVSGVTGVAIVGGENLEALIDIIGAIFFASLGLLVPAILDVLVNWKDEWGAYNWKLIKNIIISFLAIFGMVSGTYYAVVNIIEK